MISLLLRLSAGAMLIAAGSAPQPPYWIRVIDAQTGRGVPLVRISSTQGTRWTDSNGVAAFDQAELQDKDVAFSIDSAGYRFDPPAPSEHGVTLHVRAGTHADLKLTRLNIAERLYRVTGANIYGDTVRAGLKAPIAEPLLNAGVTGQDTNIAVTYKGRIFWCWGDTDGQPIADGKRQFNGKTTCATSALPGQGGLPPSMGVDFTYFKRPDGFVRGMLPIAERGLVWIEGLFTARDEQGQERLLATYTRQTAKSPPSEAGIAAFDDSAGIFRVVARFPDRKRRHSSSHPFHVNVDGKDYLYLYPLQRVPFTWRSILDPAAYEAYTCLKPGTTLEGTQASIERDATGRVVCGWKHDAEWIPADKENALVEAGTLDAAHANFPLVNTSNGKPTRARADSVTWNEYRKKWILLSKDQGTVYYSEADQPTGPWIKAVPIATQLPYRLYNIVQHPFFDAEGGRIIYFEGTFTAKLSATNAEVPDYNYNDLMYRLDLADPRLRSVQAP